MNVFFNERTQYLLFALAQWYHLLIHPQNMKLVLMILRLSMMIASSLKWRLQIQNSTVNVGLSRGFFSFSRCSLCGARVGLIFVYWQYLSLGVYLCYETNNALEACTNRRTAS